jgi:hypothetical protein
MSTVPPPISEPDPSTFACPSGDKIGPCGSCQRKTWKYGNGGSPLCQWCMDPVQQQWGTTVRHKNTRSQLAPPGPTG